MRTYPHANHPPQPRLQDHPPPTDPVPTRTCARRPTRQILFLSQIAPQRARARGSSYSCRCGGICAHAARRLCILVGGGGRRPCRSSPAGMAAPTGSIGTPHVRTEPRMLAGGRACVVQGATPVVGGAEAARRAWGNRPWCWGDGSRMAALSGRAECLGAPRADTSLSPSAARNAA